MIKDVIVRELRVIPDERGRLGEILRVDWPEFSEFAQAYFTTNYPGVVKAWHKHEKQEDNVTCVSGMIKLVMCDKREGSETYGEVQEVYLGEHAPRLVRIPRGVYHGWKCVSEKESIVVNLPTRMYDYENPDEQRLDWDTAEIDYNWDCKNG